MSYYKGYEFFYTNGTSHTKGGGLEEPKIRPNWNVLNSYKQKYGVSWKTRSEVNWPTRLSNILDIPVVNEAECGGGLYRSVRMGYDFIQNNLSLIGKFFILLEVSAPHRFDVFFSPTKQYYIVNTQNKKLTQATVNYYPDLVNHNVEQKYFDTYIDLHIDWETIFTQHQNTLLGFYSYCKLMGIPIKLLSYVGFQENNSNLWKRCNCNLKVNEEFFCKCDSTADSVISPLDFAINYKHRICDEIDSVTDTHPGYFGHIKYANFLSTWLDKHL